MIDVAIKDLRPIGSAAHSRARPGLRALSDDDLLEATRNPTRIERYAPTETSAVETVHRLLFRALVEIGAQGHEQQTSWCKGLRKVAGRGTRVLGQWPGIEA